MQIYLESVLAREDYAKEVKLFELGPRFLDRYRDIFTRLYREDRDLTLRRDAWGFGLGLLGTAALYGGYVWIAAETVLGAMTVGQMTMYLMLFRQGQAAVSAALSAVSGLYEDNLYLSNLFEYLEQPVGQSGGKGAAHRARSRRRHPLRGCRIRLSGRDHAGAVRHRSARSAGREPGVGRARTAPARPR